MSTSCIMPSTVCESGLHEPNWYAVHLSSQEVFGRGLASYLIKKEFAPSAGDIRTTFALQNFLGLAAMGIIALAAHPVARWYGQQQLYILLLAAAAACYGYAFRGVPLALLERNFDYLKISVIEVLESVLFYAAAIPLAWLGHIEAGFAFAIVLRGWGPTLLTFILKPVRPALWFRLTEIGPIADFGFSVAAGSLVNIAIYSVPAVFVGKLAGMKELGQAQMAFSLYSNLLFVTAAVVRLNLSVYARMVDHTLEFAATVNQHLHVLSAALVPFIVLFAGLSPVWTSLVFGQKWQGLPGLLLVQAPGYLFAAVFWGVLNPALLVSGKHRRVLLWLAGFFLLYCVLTRWLSPAWGAMGVMVAFSSTEILLHPLLFFLYGLKRLAYRRFFPEIAVGAGFTGLLWSCARHSLWAGFLCATFYLIVWYVRNWKLIASARTDFDLTGWYRSAQNSVLPANR